MSLVSHSDLHVRRALVSHTGQCVYGKLMGYRACPAVWLAAKKVIAVWHSKANGLNLKWNRLRGFDHAGGDDAGDSVVRRDIKIR